MKLLKVVLWLTLVGLLGSETMGAASSWLYGIHWFGPPSCNPDVDEMTGAKDVWDLETVMTNEGGGQWGPDGQLSRFQNVVSQGHTIIMRVQPVWGKAFPWPEDTDPSMAEFLDQVTYTASLYKDICHIWHLGNEMNLDFEWGGRHLMPEDYIEGAVQFADRIHAVSSSLGPQIVLVGPPAPGDDIGGSRWMTCTEYWNRMLDHINNNGYQSKFQGVAMHSYSNLSWNVDECLYWFESQPGVGYRYQAGLIDNKSFSYYPIYVTEWNRYTGSGNGPDEYVSAQFLHRAFTGINSWNQTAHPIVCACWYIYYDWGGWAGYSLRSLKSSDDYNHDVWHAFQYACTQNYLATYPGGAPTPAPTPTPGAEPTSTPTPAVVDDYFSSETYFDADWTPYGNSPQRFLKYEWWCSHMTHLVEIQCTNGGYYRIFDQGWAGGDYTLTMDAVRGMGARYIRVDSNGGTNPNVYDRVWNSNGGSWNCEYPGPIYGTVGASGEITVFLGTNNNGQYEHLRITFYPPAGPPPPTNTPAPTDTPAPTNTPAPPTPTSVCDRPAEDLGSLTNMSFQNSWPFTPQPQDPPGWFVLDWAGGGPQYYTGAELSSGRPSDHRCKYEFESGPTGTDHVLGKEINWGSAQAVDFSAWSAGRKWDGWSNGTMSIGVDLDGCAESWSDADIVVHRTSNNQAWSQLNLTDLSRPAGAGSFTIMLRANRSGPCWNCQFDEVSVVDSSS